MFVITNNKTGGNNNAQTELDYSGVRAGDVRYRRRPGPNLSGARHHLHRALERRRLERRRGAGARPDPARARHQARDRERGRGHRHHRHAPGRERCPRRLHHRHGHQLDAGADSSRQDAAHQRAIHPHRPGLDRSADAAGAGQGRAEIARRFHQADEGQSRQGDDRHARQLQPQPHLRVDDGARRRRQLRQRALHRRLEGGRRFARRPRRLRRAQALGNAGPDPGRPAQADRNLRQRTARDVPRRADLQGQGLRCVPLRPRGADGLRGRARRAARRCQDQADHGISCGDPGSALQGILQEERVPRRRPYRRCPDQGSR